jgi:HSP20 family molecular chaperone IbpA
MNENVMQKNPMATEEQTRKSPMFTPHVDIRESNEELVILADMPGVDGKSIDIQFEDGALVVHGTVKPRQSPAVRFLR